MSYKLLMDHRDFSEGQVLSRSEMRKTKKMMEDAKTPAEKLEDEYKALAKAAQTGAIDERAYNNEIAKSEERFRAAEKSTKSWGESLGRFKTIAVGVAGVVGGITVATGFLVNKIKQANQEYLDFERFGLNAAESLGTVKILALETGLQVEDFADLMKDLSVRIGEASIEGGAAAESFDRISFNYQKFIKADPMTQLKAYADAISKVKGETEALTEVDILLSDAGTKVIDMLREGSGAFDDASTKADQLGTNVSKIDIANITAANEAILSIETSISSFTTLLAIKAAPIIENIVENLTKAIGGSDGSDGTVEPGTLTTISNAFSAAFTTGQHNANFLALGLTGTRGEFQQSGGMQGFMENFRRLEAEQFAGRQRQLQLAHHQLQETQKQTDMLRKSSKIPESLSD